MPNNQWETAKGTNIKYKTSKTKNKYPITNYKAKIETQKPIKIKRQKQIYRNIQHITR